MRNRTSFLLLIAIIPVLSCNHPATEKAAPAVDTVMNTEVKEAVPRLKELKINAAYIDTKSKSAKRLTEPGMTALQVEKLMERPVDKSTAHFEVLDTLLSTKKGIVLLITHKGTNEQFAWVVAYNSTGSYLSKAEVFYRDFVEYLLNREAEIKNNKVSVKMTTDGGENEAVTIRYFLNDQQGLERGK